MGLAKTSIMLAIYAAATNLRLVRRTATEPEWHDTSVSTADAPTPTDPRSALTSGISPPTA
jgi:hypothetical protein